MCEGAHVIPSRGIISCTGVVKDERSHDPERAVIVPDCRRPYTATDRVNGRRVDAAGEAITKTYLVELLVKASPGSCSSLLRTAPIQVIRDAYGRCNLPGSMATKALYVPISFQSCKSLLAWTGMPGKALKLEEAQKNVSFHSGTNIQLGSGWKPGSMGLKKVELSPYTKFANNAGIIQNNMAIKEGILTDFMPTGYTLKVPILAGWASKNY